MTGQAIVCNTILCSAGSCPTSEQIKALPLDLDFLNFKLLAAIVTKLEIMSQSNIYDSIVLLI